MNPADPPPATRRLASIDAYRGAVMFLMMAEALRFAAIAKVRPGEAIWEFLAYHQAHVEWIGCSLHDLIQPSFSFLVGVALPFSIASRLARGQSRGRMSAHALWRALILIALGIFLRSVGKERTNFTFEDTLTQIGLGYPFLFLLGFRPNRDRLIALGVILVGYWAAFAAYPGPGTDFDSTTMGVPAAWPHRLTGFEAHWDKAANLARDFDVWFLNLFPRAEPFRFNKGGYATLSFIPTLATMLLGLLAGDLLRGDRSPWRKVGGMILAGLVLLVAGWGLGALGVCPVVKRIWTPSWVLFSGGWCLLILAVAYSVLDIPGWSGWAFPLIVIGMNSIAAYVLAHLIEDFIAEALSTHLGPEVFGLAGPDYVPLVRGAAVLLVLWLILFWMYRRKLFLRI